jgi:hypothetical protein
MSTKEHKIVAVHLLKPHRHAGRDYKPGTPEKPTVLKLREDKADWLVNQEAAEYPPAAATAAAKTAAPAAPVAPASAPKIKE